MPRVTRRWPRVSLCILRSLLFFSSCQGTQIGHHSTEKCPQGSEAWDKSVIVTIVIHASCQVLTSELCLGLRRVVPTQASLTSSWTQLPSSLAVLSRRRQAKLSKGAVCILWTSGPVKHKQSVHQEEWNNPDGWFWFLAVHWTRLGGFIKLTLSRLNFTLQILVE